MASLQLLRPITATPSFPLNLRPVTATPSFRLNLRPITATPSFRHPLHPPTTFKPLKPLSDRKLKPLKVSNSITPTPAADRLISAVGYCLPLFNGLQYGRALFMQYPSLSIALNPILPIISLYHSIPYCSIIVFFALYLTVVRNPSFSHYVRFNAMQALVLDVLLVIPVLVQRILSPGRSGFGSNLMVMGHNAVFVFIVFCFVYSLVFCVLGKTPYLPFVADAAGRQI